MTNASVVIVNFNSGRFLKDCVDSVCRSDCSFEIIVVDNASVDGSVDFLDNLVSSHDSLHVIRNEENRGFAAGNNQGIELSRSEHVLLLNPDCLVFPHTIRLLCEALDADASTGIVGGLVFNFDGSEQRGCRRYDPTLSRSLGKIFRRQKFVGRSNQVDMTDEPLPEQRICVDAVSGSFLMIRRTTFSVVGGMDEGFFLHFEDLDLCRRVRDAGWKIVFAPDISIFHYQGGSSDHSSSNVSWEKHRGMWRYQRKHYGRHLWFRGLVFVLVWAHFLLQKAKWMFTRRSQTVEGRKGATMEWIGFPSVNNITSGENGNRLLVLGVMNQPVRDMINFGTTIGWLIYGCNEADDAQRAADVHWLDWQYFDKVPPQDAPEFNGLLIAPSFSCRAAVDRVVEKCRIRRIGIIQSAKSPDASKEDDLAKSLKPEVINESLAGELMEDNVLDCEIRLISSFPPELAVEDHLVGIERGQTIEDCFSWFST